MEDMLIKLLHYYTHTAKPIVRYDSLDGCEKGMPYVCKDIISELETLLLSVKED